MTKSKNAPLVVVGAGYVGLITAVAFARHRDVRLVDLDEELIAQLEAGHPHIFEPGLKKEMANAIERLSLSFHTDLDAVLRDSPPRTMVFIAVGTPTRSGSMLEALHDGEAPMIPGNGHLGILSRQPQPGAGEAAELKYVDRVIEQLRGRDELAAIMKSTVPPGTGARISKEIAERGDDLLYISCPEFLQEGAAFEGVFAPDRIVVGREQETWATKELRELHCELVPGAADGSTPYLEMGLTSAETIKHSSNFLLAVRLSAVNQIANVCEQVGADVRDVMEGVGADKRIGSKYSEPGVGFGGSCLGKDVRALRHTAAEADLRLTLADTVLEINEQQAVRVVDKLEDRLGCLESKTVALLGIAFKANTGDVRASPAFAIANQLRARDAKVRAFDPQPEALEAAPDGSCDRSPEERFAREELASSEFAALEGAHAAVIVTEWECFRSIDWEEAAEAMAGTLVLDGRNILDGDAVRAADLRYEGTGRESKGLRAAAPQRAAEG